MTESMENSKSPRERAGVPPNTSEPIWDRSLFTAMHWLHWLIILLSLVLTFTAWRVSLQQINDKAAVTFERETSKITELVLERLQRYEDALWAGVTHINSSGGNVDFTHWRDYANGIGIERKYPGTNGIGVIHFVTPSKLEDYLQKQRELRPNYSIHPQHDKNEYWPISYIIPETGNEEAVGLDMAHEKNRYAAALLARDTGRAQITGPITLVQDEQHTPGFLFFAPFYGSHEVPSELHERRSKIVGLVYSPFVVRNLVDGVLSQKFRNISFSIHDAGTEIFTENSNEESGYDPSPLFESAAALNLYGREWIFNFRSNREFRSDLGSAQPTTILIGGIVVDLLIVLLFILISKNSRRNEQHAAALLQAQKRIEQANEELSHFNYRTSHDLVAPLKTIRGYVNLAQFELKENNVEEAANCLDSIKKQALRLEKLVEDLLNLCRIDHQDAPPEPIAPQEIFENTRSTLQSLWQEKDVTLQIENELETTFKSQSVRIRQILENLVSNAIKYSDPDKPERWVKVRFRRAKANWVRIEVEDNGIGIPGENRDKVFEMFYRAGNNSEHGSGLGNYLVKKHVAFLNGNIDYRTSPQGTVFMVDLPT